MQHFYYLVKVPHVESSLVAVSEDRLSVRTEEATQKAKITSTDLTDSHLHQRIYQVTRFNYEQGVSQRHPHCRQELATLPSVRANP